MKEFRKINLEKLRFTHTHTHARTRRFTVCALDLCSCILVYNCFFKYFVSKY